MPNYRLTLEVEVRCPVDTNNPELTITPEELMNNILTPRGSGGYALCVRDNPKKLTGDIIILSAQMHEYTCEFCGFHREKKDDK